MSESLSFSMPAEPAFFIIVSVLLFALIVWSLVWKGIALWKAARLSHKK